MAKEAAIKTFVVVAAAIATVVTTLLVGGARLGATEQAARHHAAELQVIQTRQDTQEDNIDIMRQEQAYQKGVVNTKLENLEAGQERILQIITEWEPE